LGNILSGYLVKKLGTSRSLVLGAVIAVTGLALIPIAGASGSLVALILAGIIHGIGEGTFGPTAMTLRQTSSPDHLRGRVNSVQRVLTWGGIALGSLAAGLATKLFGLPGSLWIGGLGACLCLLLLVRRGIRAEIMNPLSVAGHPATSGGLEKP
jgi:MFS family permease